MDIAGRYARALAHINRNYGQLDKNVFGGLLPGGAATPIGAAFQRSGMPKAQQPSDFDRRKAALIDAAATGIAKAQPFVEKTIKSAPPVIQQAISKGFNVLPFSANLFSRYYTGIGPTNLQIPETLANEVNKAISDPSYSKNIFDASTKEEKNLSAILNAPNAAGMDIPNARQFANDALAEVRSRIKNMETGAIPYTPYATRDTTSVNNNPLTSPSTSFGNVWFNPSKDGYIADEKYDFVYGAADKKTPMGPGMPELNPSQEAALISATGMRSPNGTIVPASAHPLTFFGRSIVMKMPDKSFNYPINIR